MKVKIFLSLAIFSTFYGFAQEATTRKDSLQGGLRPERTCFDVLHYGLNITVDIVAKHIKGYNEIDFKTTTPTSKIQLDLFENMNIDSIVLENKKLIYKREFNAVFINFPKPLAQNSKQKLFFYYSGNPIIAKKAPWDGGFVFSKDTANKDWIGVAVQGTGASLWYPVKDSQSDEPDFGATINVAVPNGLMNVSNGRLMGSEDLKNGYTRWDWEVKSPINTYDITLNIGDYVHFGENYKGLDLNYYVLRENEAKAKLQFEEVKPMLDCFQEKFGTYPFADDGYKLVETPYLGMEHQSAVAYGNKYQKGYLGRDLSDTGVGLLFDYIIVHESGHEWFGNSITSRDIADMWIHEGFTMYSEVVYLECHYGYEKAMTYLKGLQQNVRNDQPIIGPYGVNKEGSGDMYPKGALMLNTIRHVINNDKKWWSFLHKYAETFRHKIIDTETVVAFFNAESGINLTPIFNQYLRQLGTPSLDIRLNKGLLEYRWRAAVPNFEMPVAISIDTKTIRLKPTLNWQKSTIKIKDLAAVKLLDEQFYVSLTRY